MIEGSQEVVLTGALSGRIYEEVRRRIILGIYPQGMRLAEQGLAEDLNVSRVPLREAIPRLETEGFITTTPRRSARVARWSGKTVNDLLDVRLALEVSAAGYAAHNVAAGVSISPLETAFEVSRQALSSGDAYEIASASASFHQEMVDLTTNTLLSSLMRAVSGRVTWLSYLAGQLDVGDTCQEHRELINGIQTGNVRMAEALAYAHIERDRAPGLAAAALAASKSSSEIDHQG